MPICSAAMEIKESELIEVDVDVDMESFGSVSSPNVAITSVVEDQLKPPRKPSKIFSIFSTHRELNHKEMKKSPRP